MPNHGRCCTCPNCTAAWPCGLCGDLCVPDGSPTDKPKAPKTPQYLCVEFHGVCPCRCDQCFFCTSGSDQVGYKIIYSPLHGYIEPDDLIFHGGNEPIGVERCGTTTTPPKEGCCVKTIKCEERCGNGLPRDCCQEVFQTVTLKQNSTGCVAGVGNNCEWEGHLSGLVLRTYAPLSVKPGPGFGPCACGVQTITRTTPACTWNQCDLQCREGLAVSPTGQCASQYQELCPSTAYADICPNIKIKATKISALATDISVSAACSHFQKDWVVEAWVDVYNISLLLAANLIPAEILEENGKPVSLVTEETWSNINGSLETPLPEPPKCKINVFLGAGPGCSCTQPSGAISNCYACPPQAMDPQIAPCPNWASWWTPCDKPSEVTCWKCVAGEWVAGIDFFYPRRGARNHPSVQVCLSNSIGTLSTLRL
jgi:hypothetical protein